MSSLNLDFTSGNVAHKVTLEKTDSAAERALSIDGRYYKLLGSQEALSLLNARLKELPSTEFTTFKELEFTLKGAGPSEKTAALYRKVVDKAPTPFSAQAIADKISKCRGSQHEVKKILFEDGAIKKDIPRLIEVALHLASRGETIKAGYVYFFAQKLIPEGEKAPSLLQMGKAFLQRGKEANDLLALDLAEFHLRMALQSPNQTESQEARRLIDEVIVCAEQIRDRGPASLKEAASELVERLQILALLSEVPPAALQSYSDLPCSSLAELDKLKHDVKPIRDAFKSAEAYQKRADDRKIEQPGMFCQIPDGEGLLSIHVKVTGTARAHEPIVILEAGLGSTSHDWAYVQELLGKYGPLVISYDRAGLGWSEPGKGEPTSEQTLARLEAILKTLKLAEKPIIFVGHSYGGVLAQLFTLNHPELVRGMVLVDSATDASGSGPFLRKTVHEWLPPAVDRGKFFFAYDEKTALFVNQVTTKSAHFDTMIKETDQFGSSLTRLREKLAGSEKPPFKVPIDVISAGLSDFNEDLLMDEEWKKEWKIFSDSQMGLLERSQSSKQTIAEESDHFPQHHQPALVVQHILALVLRASQKSL